MAQFRINANQSDDGWTYSSQPSAAQGIPATSPWGQPANTKSVLEAQPDDGTTVRTVKGVGRGLKNLFYDLPRAGYHAFNDPKGQSEMFNESDQNYDAAEDAANSRIASGKGTFWDRFAFNHPEGGGHDTSTLGLAMQRMFGAPQVQSQQKGDAYQALTDQQRQQGMDVDNFWNGTQHKANIYHMGQYVPAVGPWAADVVDRMSGGTDVEGKPQQADFAGGLGEVGAMMGGPKLAGKGLKYAVKSKLGYGALGNRTVPDTGGMKTSEVYKTMRDAGVDLSTGQAGQGNLARFVEDKAANTPGGAGRMAKFRTKQSGQVANALSNLEDKFDPTGAGKDVADQGALIQRALESADDVAHQNASDAFTQGMSKLFNYSTADTADIASGARDLKAKLLTGEVKSLQPQQAMAILDEIEKAYGDKANNKSMFDAVFRDRSRMMKSQFTDANVPGEGEGALRQMGGIMRNSLENAATRAGKLNEFNSGMKGWQDYIDTFGDKRSPLLQAMNTPDVTKVLDKFIGNKGSYQAVQMLKQAAPEFVNVLKREFVRRLYDTKDTGVKENFGNMQNRLLHFNEPFVNELFAPDELKQIRGITAGSKSIYNDINPPGSGRYAGQTISSLATGGGIASSLFGMAQHNPELAMGGAAVGAGIPVVSNVASRLMTSQPITDFFMGYKEPTAGIQSGAAAAAGSGAGSSQGGAPAGAQTIPNPFQRTGSGLRNPARGAGSKGSQAGFAKIDLLTGGVADFVSRMLEKRAGEDSPPSDVLTKPTRSTDPKLLELSQKYNESARLPKIPRSDYAEADPRAPKIADAYEAMKHNPGDPKVKASYEALGKQIRAQFDFATKNGIDFEPWKQEGQPYKNSSEMTRDVRDNGHLYFFQGGEMPADHPLSAVDPDGLSLNDKLRAVHDLFGHAVEGNQFGPRGEENAWLSHSKMFTKEAIPAMTTETKGQNSWVNFGKHIRDAKNPPSVTERPFAEQKAGLLPQEFHSRDIPTDYINAVHYSNAPDITELDPDKYGANPYHDKTGEVVNRPDLTRQKAFPQYWQNETYLGKDTDLFREKGGDRFGERQYRYTAKLDPARYYDLDKDPQGIVAKAKDELLAQNQAKYGAKLVPSEVEAEAYAIKKLKDMGYSGRIAGNDLIASWDKVPVERDVIPPKYDVMLTQDERASLKTDFRRQQFASTLQKLPALKEWTDVAKAGEVGSKWYERSNKAFDSLVDAAPEYFEQGDREKFANLVAATSPQQGVYMNLREALNFWKKWVDADRPTETKTLEKMMDRNFTMSGAKVPNAVKALRGEEMWPDIDKAKYFKVPSFAKNLNGLMNNVTNDSWMGIFSGIAEHKISLPENYHPVSVMTRLAAKELGWKPAEAQAAIWVFTRTLAEQSGWSDARYSPHEVLGLMDDATTAKFADDFADIMAHDHETRGLLQKLGVDLDQLDTKLKSIGHPQVTYGTATASGDSFGKLADRIEAARSARQGQLPRPKTDSNFTLDFGEWKSPER